METFKQGKNRNILLVILGILLIILICTYTYWFFNVRNKVNEPDSQTFTPVGDINKEVVFSDDIGIDLMEEALALKLKYNDVVGWMKVPGTSIDTAVFQSSDNSRYLRHDRDNNNTKWGEMFLDYRNNINEMDDRKNFIIYGHNTSEDSWLTPVMNYASEDFFKGHKFIEFSTVNKNYKWEIFTVYKTTTDFFYIDTNFANKDEYFDFISLCKSKSLYNTNVEITKDDTILTLSTCEYSQENGRFVIQAKLVKE